MSQLIGANVEELRAFAKEVDQASFNLVQQSQILSAAVNQAGRWKGPDADRFRQ